MKVFIAGMDGYLGWPLTLTLTEKGHEVAGADLGLRREWVSEMGSDSAIPILSMDERKKAYKDVYGKDLTYWHGDLTDYDFVKQCFEEFKPDAIVHLGQMPSAPYSMASVKHCTWTHTNNVTSNINFLFAMKEVCPEAHLVKLGTMGEYGTPEVDIPEGFFELEFRGRKQRLPFPRMPGSWYHLTKVHDSNNVLFASRMWGTRATDIMQGVVYGTRIDEMKKDPRLFTRYDFDQSFGTAINRFCAQAAIGHPLTPFGKGTQKRTFLPLRDSMQCLTLAVENPAAKGEYRVFNQFEEVYNITELAQKVQKVGNSQFDLNVEIKNLENPRKELEEHYYNPDHQHLLDLGYKPTSDMEKELSFVLEDLLEYRSRIEEHKEALIPDIRWDGNKKKSVFI